ncbi:hypothetical protein HK102_004506 [Quaeritorhiza haematococci]|nr:hypothetical protein HK102_004506 [Quaeritorhiza haematococci]
MLWGGFMFHERKSDYIKYQIRLQWRALVIALVILVLWSIMFVWYYTQEGKASLTVDRNTPWVREWIDCIVVNDPNGQEICSPIATVNGPDDNVNDAIFTGLFTSGIWVLLVWGTQKTAYTDFIEAWFPSWYARLQSHDSKSGNGT